MNKAVFLDRDGVINVEKEYLHKPEDFEFIPGVVETCRRFIESGFKLVIITNQAGIARGFYTDEDFHNVNQHMLAHFKKNQIQISHVYYCPHHPKFSGECDCRKPAPGMLIQAAEEHDIELKQSIIIGDKESDVNAGINAGLCKQFLISTGHKIDRENTRATAVIDSLEEVFNYI